MYNVLISMMIVVSFRKKLLKVEISLQIVGENIAQNFKFGSIFVSIRNQTFDQKSKFCS